MELRSRSVAAGTPFYTAPELVSQNKLLQSSDVFSFGVIMWSLSHSAHPFVIKDGIYERHPTFPKFETTIPTTYSLLAIACMKREPTARPTFPQVIQILTELSVELQPPGAVSAAQQVPYYL